MKDNEPKIYIPSQNETAVISDKPKTAALFYDRVWYPGSPIPLEANLFEDLEVKFSSQIGKGGREVLVEVNPLKYERDCIPEYKELDGGKIASISPSGHLLGNKETMEFIYRSIAKAFSKKINKPIQTLFSSSEAYSKEYQEGDKDVIVSTMDNLQIVDEEKITWEQVLELRRDEESRMKYKKFMHWIDEEREKGRNLHPKEYREWRLKVYLKDGHTCKKCETRGGKLVAHHKDGWSRKKERRYDITNGIIYCADCHKHFHQKYGYGNNYECQSDFYSDKQLIEAFKLLGERFKKERELAKAS